MEIYVYTDPDNRDITTPTEHLLMECQPEKKVNFSHGPNGYTGSKFI